MKVRLLDSMWAREGTIVEVEKREDGWLVFRTQKGKKFGIVQLNPIYEGTTFEIV